MRRRANRDAQHIQLYHWVMKSPAWAALSGNAVKVLLDLWRCHNGINNGQISYSCDQAGVAINASKSTGWRVLKELMQFGFLRMTQDAGFGSDEARLYMLTMERIGKQPATKDLMKLTADDLAKNRFPVSPMKLSSFTYETGENGILTAANKINDLTKGVGDRKNGTSRTPLKTAKKPTKLAQNKASLVSSMKLEQPNPSFTHETHIIYHAGFPKKETTANLDLGADLDVRSNDPSSLPVAWSNDRYLAVVNGGRSR